MAGTIRKAASEFTLTAAEPDPATETAMATATVPVTAAVPVTATAVSVPVAGAVAVAGSVAVPVAVAVSVTAAVRVPRVQVPSRQQIQIARRYPPRDASAPGEDMDPVFLVLARLPHAQGAAARRGPEQAVFG